SKQRLISVRVCAARVYVVASWSVSVMIETFKQKAQKASAAASAAVKQGVDAAKSAMGSDPPTRHGQARADPESLAQLCAMGFPRPQAEAALQQVGGQDTEAAIAFLCQQHGQTEPAGSRAGDSESPSTRLVPTFRLDDDGERYSPSQWVEVHSMSGGAAARALNGEVGQIVSYVSEQERFLVDFAGQPRLLRAANLREASGAVKAKATVQATVKSARSSMKDAKRRAEAFFGGGTASSRPSGAQPRASAAPDPPQGHVLGFSAGAPADPPSRRAALEAAERRLAEARARNSGTMEDYRRWQREQIEAGQGQPLAAPAAAHAGARRGIATRVIGEERAPAARAAPAAEDEEEDLQRALEASLAPAGAAAPAAPGPPREEAGGAQEARPRGSAAACAAAAAAEEERSAGSWLVSWRSAGGRSNGSARSGLRSRTSWSS
ncbi:unnamed protein product, partial [Prorocentrum cordatum]